MTAGRCDTATDFMKEIDFSHLQLWGYSNIVIGLREQLLNSLTTINPQRTNIGYLGLAYRKRGRLQEVLECVKALDMARQGNDT